MSKTEFEQLQQAVKREPGSRAFALLAERHLKRGEVGQALEVCNAGFEVNPAYERGAVVFLEVLGQLEDISRASEVYGRSIAEHPRSSELRIAWAKLLQRAGRDYEARLRAKEAADLAPESKEARALLAALSATPPPARRKTGGIVARPPAATGGIREKVAALKPRAAGAMHGRFDFTPTPAYVEPPAGVDTAGLDAMAEFFDVSDQAAAGRVQIEVAPPPVPPGARFTGPIDPTRTTSENLFPGAPPPFPQGPPATEDAAPPSASVPPPALPPETPAPQVAPPSPVAPPLPAADEEHPTDASHAASSAIGASTPLVAAPGKRRRRRWWVFPLAALLMATPVAGALIYRHAKELALRKTLKSSMAAVRADRLPAWLESRGRACQGAADHKRSAAAQVSCALLTAHLVARFSRENLAAPLAEHLDAARRLAPDHPWTKVAQLLQSLAEAPAKASEASLEGLPASANDWHVTYARVRIRLAKGESLLALKEITELDDAQVSAGLLTTALRIARLRADFGLHRKLLARGLRLFPDHPGLRLEQHYTSDRPLPAKKLALLRKEVETIPSLRADLDLLLARDAAGKSDFSTAAVLAARASKLAPHTRPEGAWRAALWQFAARTKNASATEARTATLFARIKGLVPGASLDRARILLSLRRSDEAYALLKAIPPAALDPAGAKERRLLEVRVEAGRSNLKGLKELCPARGTTPAMLGVCADAFYALGSYSRLRGWLKTLARTDRNRPYLRALLTLGSGDVEGAARLLKKVPTEAIAPTSRMLLDARIAIGSYRLDRAISTLREAVERDRFSVRTQLALAKALVLRGNDTEARQLLGSIERAQPSDPATLASIGDAWIALGNTDRAAAIAKRGVALHRENPSLQLLAARIALANRRYSSARRLLLRLLKRTPNNPEVRLDLGQIALHRRNERRASKHFGAALRTRPKDPALRLSLAIAYARAGKHKKALPHVKYAVDFFERAKQHGRAIDALITVGKLLAVGRSSARKSAQELLFRASTKAGAPPDAFYHLGLVHKANDDAPRAIWCFKQVLRRAPKMALAQLQLGLVQIKQRKWRKRGRRALKRYLELVPKGPKARKVRAILARRR